VGDWVVLELSPRCEGEDPEVLRQAISHLVRGGEVFLPAAVTEIGGDRVYTYLVDGYAFIRRDHTDAVYMRLENSRYVQSVLTEPGSVRGPSRKLSTVSEEEIEKLQRQVKAATDQGIGIGDTVIITSGPYRNIEAAVVEDLPEQGMVQVHVELRSKQSLVMLPRGFLRVVKRAPLSPVFNKLLAFRAWSRMAQALLAWEEGGWDKLQVAYEHYHRLQEWTGEGRRLYSFLGAYHGALDRDRRKVHDQLKKLREVQGLADKYQRLWTFVASFYGFAGQEQLEAIQVKLVELHWFDDVQRRVRDLQKHYDALRRKLTSKNGRRHMTQNVLVDGHNLAFRCLYAPGMAQLFDGQGRPTGVILGCLRSLGALKKKYPAANLYVTWDGSSQRRKSVFGEYKANRGSHAGLTEGFDQMTYLREILPSLGATQAFNVVEEADDVIGTLVQGELKTQRNVIYSSDRDLLQLVTPTTALLIPAIGSRKEILFKDPKTVEETTGFLPDKMVQFRALCGDPSDNIPGVPRVPKKVLRSLLQAHGTVDGIYKSGLAGLTKNQYERLRSAEPQVRINIGLMALVNVEVSLTYPDVDGKVASRLMQEVGVKPQPVLRAFGLDGE